MKKLFFIFFILGTQLFSQKEAAHWYFGFRAGLSFQNGAPVNINTSESWSQYSSSGISDSLGNLLFYVREGDIIYNKNNDTMANGYNIGGNIGAQASLVVRKSGSQYYVFTNKNASWPNYPQTNYAIVDMGLAAGLGSVVVSNHTLSPNGVHLVSKLAATKHCNQKDYWLLAHGGGLPGSNLYYAYLVTADSIYTSPVITAIGSNQPHNYGAIQGFYRGLHKFSPNGKKVCATMPYRGVELYDFDNGTGVLSNALILDSILNPGASFGIFDPNTVGVEFSPDGTKLYITYKNNHPFLCQFNLCAGSPSAIAASKTIVSYDTINNNAAGYFSLQNALDGKMYLTNSNAHSIGVINNPNALGTACNYITQALVFGVHATYPTHTISIGSGLPNFVSNYFEQKPTLPAISGSINCGSAAFSVPVLCPATGYSVTAYSWNFGDPVSGASNSSNSSNPQHTFSANGTYTVKLTLQYPCGADTLAKTIIITGLPTLSVSGKTVICIGENTKLNYTGAHSYSLNNIALTQANSILQPIISTTYTLSGSDSGTGCSSLKVINVSVLSCAGVPNFNKPLKGIKVYPNPTEGYFLMEVEFDCEVSVIDISGRRLFEANYISGNHGIDLNKFAENKGIYFLKIKTKEQTQIIKLIKE